MELRYSSADDSGSAASSMDNTQNLNRGWEGVSPSTEIFPELRRYDEPFLLFCIQNLTLFSGVCTHKISIKILAENI